jgi:hypothetical protein
MSPSLRATAEKRNAPFFIVVAMLELFWTSNNGPFIPATETRVTVAERGKITRECEMIISHSISAVRLLVGRAKSLAMAEFVRSMKSSFLRKAHQFGR